MEWSFEIGLPLRGAIGIGTLLEDSSRHISLSAVVPALLQDEKEHKWAGIVVRPDAAEAILRNLYGVNLRPAKEGSMFIVRYPAPREDDAAERWCLNWVQMCDLPDIAPGLAYLAEPKKSNTEAFIRHVEALPRFETALGHKSLAAVRA